jgi:methanogenic corrinoid protein MtbC1
VAVLRWAKNNVDQGFPISSVNAQLQDSVKKHAWPEAVLNDKNSVAANPAKAINRVELTNSLINSLIRRDERMSADLFADALGSLKLTGLFEEILIPTLVEVGNRWERGEISVATEHFASNFIQARILAIFQSLPLHPSAPKVILGCGPDELHVIGPMMLAVLLRDAGFRVEYLGPDLPLEDLLGYVREETPRIVVLSATMKESAEELIRFARSLQGLKPAVHFGYGGSAFILNPDLQKKIDGHYLGPSISRSVEIIQQLVPLKRK